MERIDLSPPIAQVVPILQQDKFYLQTYCHREIRMHDHSFLELTYILNGTVEHTLDGQTTILRPGDYFIVDYGSRHAYRGVDGGIYENVDCLFLPELLDPVLKGTRSLRAVLEHYLLHFNFGALVQNPSHIVFHDDTGQILELIHRMEEEARTRDAGYTEIIRCHLIELLLLTMRKLDHAQVASAGQSISEFIIAYVAEHYAEPLTLQEIAKKLNYSLPYVSKRFKEETGASFVNYLQGYRVMQGCRLLCGTKKTLGEIAETVGYRDVKFFSSLLKRTTGLSPADYRRQHRTEA